MRRVKLGVGYRHPLADWLHTNPTNCSCLEITAEHFFDLGDEQLRQLAARYPLYVHGLGLSLGTPGPLDAQILKQFARVADLAQAQWVSEHIAFSRTADVDLGHLNPVRPDRQALQLFSEHVQELKAACGGRPVILENITTHLALKGDLSETEFLNQLCAHSGCGLLLDVTNLWINSRNHGFDPRAWLREIQPAHIVQLHAVGYSAPSKMEAGAQPARYQDYHGEAIQADLLSFIGDVLAYAPVQAVILERDANLDDTAGIQADLRKLEQLCGAA